MIWLTADTHFGHRNIIRYTGRPFSSVEEMDEVLIRNWNDVVGAEDLVFHLGDFALGSRARLIELRGLLHGQIVLIRGNHDRSANALRECGFDRVEKDWYLGDGSHMIYLSHIPQTDWAGDYHLCGHVHERWRRQGFVINVGVDQWGFRPVSLDEALGARNG